MSGAEKHGHLHKDLYGGHKGHTALDPVLITTMFRESFHLQRANAGTTDCDTAACYDRMILGPTLIADTNAGTPEPKKGYLRSITATAKSIQVTAQARGHATHLQNGTSTTTSWQKPIARKHMDL
eukprot:3935455-Ditylum_brightwellii.AAC.1